MNETFEGTAEQQRDRVQRLGRDASSAMNDAKDRLQDTLSDVTGAVKERAGQAAGAVKERAGQAAERFSDAASYVTETDPQDIWADVTRTVKSRPLESLAAAAVVGFFIGRVARRM